MPTVDQLTALRALITADFERHEKLSHALRGSDQLEGYAMMLGAAFFIAMRKRFRGGHTPSDIVQLVSEVRATFDRSGDDIDPHQAELLVRSALGEEDLAEGLPDATVIQIQMVTVSALAGSGKLGDPDQFMHEVEVLVTRWES